MSTQSLYAKLNDLAHGAHGFPSALTDTLKEVIIKIADLEDDSFKLTCLENAGVDNWDGYDYAMEEYRGGSDD